ncbi:chemotaxis protein CheW [Desulfurispora thermophila]|uniref:chemotaxis protein CheW n=1 Tax=Desulfurispora thermophila TaxID=265470 RepID=UPI000379A4AF|nr:chemotaxis protein CheW [Desulfurispora thermophila]
MEEQLVVFLLNEQLYGIDISQVLEIIRPTGVTVLPGTPDFIEGVINLRGTVIPVMDLARRFGLSSGQGTEEQRVVIVESAGVKVGLLVDGVSEVLRVTGQQIQPPPAAGLVGGVECIRGIALLENRMIILLDMNKVLQVGERQKLLELAN